MREKQRYEQITETTPEADIAGLIETVKESGHVDLRSLSPDQLAQVARWYRSDFESLSNNDRVEFLEQLMSVKEFDDKESLEFANRIDFGSRAEIGIFIYRVLDGLKFTQTFQACWSAIDYGKRSEMVLSIIREHPDLLLMIVPFVKLNRWSQNGKYTQFGEVAATDSLQRDKFSTYDKNSELIEGLLRYMESHPDENSAAVEDNLSNINPILLIPYLDRIRALNILSQQQIKRIAVAPERFLPVGIFLTTKDIEEKRTLMKELGAYYPNEDERANLNYYHPTDVTPLKLGMKLARINNRTLLRGAQTLLSTFRECRQNELGQDKLDYLFKLVEDNGIPIFAQINNLGLSKKEIATLFSRCVEEGSSPFGLLTDLSDLKKFVEFNRQQESGSGIDLEQLLVRYLIQDLQENSGYGFVGRITNLNSEGFFLAFNADDRQKIQEAVTKLAPDIWLNNISYVLKHQVMAFDELVRTCSTDSQSFIKNYNKLLYHLHQLRREGKPLETSVESLADKAKLLFSANPSLFLGKESVKIVENIYSRAEQQQFIAEQLTGNVNSNFFSALLSSKYIGQHADTCKKLLVENGHLFAAVTEYSYQWKEAKELIETKDLIDLVIRHAEYIDFSSLFDDFYLVAELGKKPARAAALVDRLTKLSNFSALAQLNREINLYGKEDQRLQKELQSFQQLEHSPKRQEKKRQLNQELTELIDNGYEANNRNLELLAKRIIEILDRACELNRFLVFDENILRTKGLDTAKYITRDLSGYIAIYPEILFKMDNRPDKGESPTLCENILGGKEYYLLMRENARLLAFRKSKYGGFVFDNDDVQPEILEQIKEMNPLIDSFGQSQKEIDHYSAILSQVKQTPFVGLYQKELEKIINNKKEEGESVIIAGSFNPDEGFERMVRTIFLLNSHSAIREHAVWLMSLPENQRTELVGLLEFSLLNNLGFLGQILRSEDFAEIKKDLQEGVEGFLLYVFGLEELSGLSFEGLSVDLSRALMTYYYGSCKKNYRQELVFKEFITHVLRGTYDFWRNWGSSTEPKDKLLQLNKLQEEKLIPKSLSLEQYQEWLNGEKNDFEETLSYRISDMKAGIRDIIGDAVADGHITEESIDLSNIEEKYDVLIEPLNIFTTRQKELRELSKTVGLTEEQQAEYKELARQIADYRREHNDEMTYILALKYLNSLKNLTAHELESQVLTLGNKNQLPLKKALSLIERHFGEEFPDFIGDINRIRQLLAGGFEQMYGGKKVSKEKLYLTDKIDLEVYAFIGERPVASCQSYDSRSGMNAGLMSYLSDPNIKIIQMYNESGDIVARSVMRLVEDDNNKPQLFIERVYSVNPHPKINEAIVNFAKLKAKRMGVDLYVDVVPVDFNQELVTADLHNNNSRSTYVYSDAGGGKLPNGRFTIRSARLIGD
ncbi:MAG: hypothetical protein WC473_03085 [Patescibacteria group bacterium]